MKVRRKILIVQLVLAIVVAELLIFGHVNHWVAPFWDINGQIYLSLSFIATIVCGAMAIEGGF